MTEEEAQSKWCPFVRGGREGRMVAGYNRIQGDGAKVVLPHESLCIASDCMAWRWKPGWGAQPGELIREIKAYRDRHDTSLVEAKNAVEAEYRSQVGQGYCGLAGAPQ